MARKITFRGIDIEEVKKMSLEQFMKLLSSKARRTLKRMNYKLKKFITKIRKSKKDSIKTHLREMVIIPEMLDKRFKIYNGKEWNEIIITPAMLGKRLGEFSHTTKLVKHSGPGIGATRGSKAVELK